MCDPLTIAGIAATVGSTVANNNAANQAASARNDALAAERIRQGGFDEQAQALNTRAQDRFQDAGAKTEAKKQALGDYFAAPSPTAGAANEAMGLPEVANNVVTREMAKKSGEAQGFVGQQGEALAEMRAFGDFLGDTSRMQGRDASEVGQVGGFKRGSSNIMPLELDAASQQGAGARFLGDILGGLGGIALNAGLTGGSLGGGGVGKLFGGNSWGGGPQVAAAARPVRAAVAPMSRFQGVY